MKSITALSAELEPLSAQERLAWAVGEYTPNIFLSSSFGIQAAVLLHMCTEVWPGMPVVLIDTGYLFPETYEFINELSHRLKLNLKVYHPLLAPAEQEAKFGKLWEQGVEGIEQYNQMNKVEPFQRALSELKPKAWVAGLRRQQSQSRENLQVLTEQRDVVKIHPILEWSNRDVYLYLKKNNLPYHPLWEKGYVSVGDVHTSEPMREGMTEEQTRFFGLKRECGIHVEQSLAVGV